MNDKFSSIEQDDLYRRMVEEIQDYAIIVLDTDGYVRNWNKGAEKIKLYSEAEIVGKHFSIFYLPEDIANNLPQKLLKQARDTGRAYHEGWRKRKDQSRFWESITITALHNKEGEVIGFTKVTRDLTQSKIAEDKLAAYTAELEIQNRELEQFAYVASHDLQEPLRKIQTFSDLIQANLDDTELVEKYLQKLTLSAKRMSALIHSLLNYSRLSKDKPANVDVDLNKVLSEVEEDFELLIEEKKATIKSNNLPTVKGNDIQLAQLFANLIGNSLKFSNGRPVIDINADLIKGNNTNELPKALQNKDYNRIIFQDNGIGFDEQYKDLIFSLFQRLHGKREYEGTGIGLALCKKIVENHGGFISASGVPGKGARFTIYLPAIE